MYVTHFREYLPYVVIIENRTDIPRRRRPLKITWSLVVCDRGYNLIYASWLEKRPTLSQISAIACNSTGEVHWDPDHGGRNWLYCGGHIPDASAANWRAYAKRLRVLSRLYCMYNPKWGSETERDWDRALAEW